ncbi:PREDICTED: uncharacterized protein LOC105556048 [Vollenhovia emeryi]|uniref:uncharacterized protein LOC105556048 n=1 Tax=Vollenhovia emeryi TaxID=411798 RepID=UPI0005F3F0C3|nr:PREDICTED: uncharacterized protein LOC105556048 [Vollenhovia emeryi]
MGEREESNICDMDFHKKQKEDGGKVEASGSRVAGAGGSTPALAAFVNMGPKVDGRQAKGRNVINEDDQRAEAPTKKAYKPFPVPDPDSGPESSGSEDWEKWVGPTGRKRKRGRPPTTLLYEGVEIRKRLEHKKVVKKLKAEAKALREVLDPKVLPRDVTPEKETVKQLEGLSAAQLAADMLANVNVVDKVADKSKNLKGTFVKELRACAKNLRAAATVVSSTRRKETETEEVEKLRFKIGYLEEQIKDLNSQLERKGREQADAHREEETGGEPMDGEATFQGPATRSGKTPNKGLKKEMGTKEAHQRQLRPVLRPTVQGVRKVVAEPAIDRVMEEVRRVMEGVSIAEVVRGDPQEVRNNLGNLITRCQGVMERIPENQKGKRSVRALPTITKVEVIKEATKAKKLTFKEALGRKAQQKEEARKASGVAQENKSAPVPKPSTSWAEVAKGGKIKKPAKTTVAPANKKATLSDKPSQNIKGGQTVKTQPTAQPTTQLKGKGDAREGGKKKTPKPRRAPRSAAVAIVFPNGEAGEGMRYIRSQIKLEDLGIDSIKPRKMPGEGTRAPAVQERNRQKHAVLSVRSRGPFGSELLCTAKMRSVQREGTPSQP